MADRVLSGEFTSAWEASKVDECVRIGVSYQSIQHYVDKANPAEAAARVAERARVTREKAEAEAKSNSVKMIFFEKGGAATAKKASSKAIKMFERGESQKLHGIINLAGEEAQTAYQAGLEAGAEEERRQFKEELESKSFQLSVFQSEVKARDESFKRMERELENERAKCQVSEAEAKAAEPRAVEEHLRSEHLRKKARVFEQRLARSERPFEEEQAAKSTTDQMTWCAAEVEEYESMIGELTEELREFRAKDLEYGRTKAAVANLRGKYAELQSLREEMRRLHKEIERLQAERGSVEEAG
jgi:hypothetical protein